MNAFFSRKIIRTTIIALGLVIAIAGAARAELADLSDVPLATSPSDAVLPNLMYVIDDSGSMMWDYMPDNVHRLANNTELENCKSCDSGSCSIAAVQCALGYPDSSDGNTADWFEPPYASAQFNQIYYNPDVSYAPGVDAAGGTLGNISPTAAPKDFYLNATTKNLTTTYTEIYYCTTSSPSAADLTNTAVCRRNGINNVGSGYFLYWKNSSVDGGFPNATGTTSTTFRHQIVRNTGHPYYFTITPHEHCSDTNLINCTLSATPTGAFTIPAPIRYCSSTGNASSTAVMSDAASSTSPKCRKKFDASSHPYPRYGRFTRTDIVPGTTTYTKGANAIRPDCANASYCTYAEELQNFANWYSYYRTRLAMMKTATGRAFLPIDDRYRVGFITINPGSPVRSTANVGSDFRYLPLATYNSTHKNDFYDILYDQTDHGSTPLRQALARVGRHYANVTTGINSGMPQDPITHSCQQNFALLTSDGYWNDNDSDARDTSATGTVGNQDNVPNTTDPFYVSRPTVTLDGVGTQTQDVTPLTVREQIVCTGDASVLGGSNNCDCAAGSNFKRVKQRTRNQQQTVAKTDGIQTSSNTTTVGADTFQDITACKATLVTTTTTNVTLTETRDCQGNGSTGAWTYGGTPQTCTCNAGREVLFRYTRTGATRTRITVDGVPASDTVTGGTITYTDSIGGAFSALPAPAGGACFNGTTLNDVAAAFAGGTTTVITTGSTTTAADITISPNPITTSGTTITTTTAWGGSADTLADVAMYYYKNDLRTGAPTSKSDNSNVPTNDKDIAKHQHMVTFTLGLGLQGQMDYVADYTSDPTGDYSKIKNADTTCAWTTGTCNWPTPTSGAPTTLDDLWHAAVNGRGIYYSASDPNTLADGLSGALAALKVQTAAASASATSSPNITETDNFIYSSTFRTVKWDGEITAQRIDTISGAVLPGDAWAAQELLDAKVGTAEALIPPGDGRNIWTLDPSGTNKLKSFEFANLTAAEQAYFVNKCTALSQCPLLTVGQQAIANNGDNMVNFLRGRSTHEATVFRDREHVLGDPVNATPAFVKAPRFNFSDVVTPTYQDFKAAQASRQGVLYIAANDGMLHAFNGDTGQEMWAYVPRMVFPNLHALATDNWDVRHEYSVDGSPQVMDIYDSGAGAWKTLLVAGLGKGGRGFYALDITNASTPKGLWEICSDATLCAVSDNDIGYSFGYPVITKRATDGKWVVLITSGMNNVGPGTGRGYLYVLDALTGAVLQKVNTLTGDTTTPSGLSKISAYANNFNVDNTATFVYGGDLLGNLWRFDMSANPPTVLLMAELKDGSGNPQSITTRPELAVVDGNRVVYVGTGRYLGEDDLSDPSTLVPPLPWAYQQSFYAIKDKNVVHGNIRTATPGLQQQTITALTADSRSTTENVVDWATKDGWYVDFNPGNTSPGERVNLDPLLALGTLVVVTNVPNNNACTVGGDAWIYQFDYRSGTYIASAPGDQVAQKFTGQTLVGVVVVRLPSGVLKGIATGATGTKTTVGVNVGGSGGVGRRVSWRELIE